MIGIALRSNPDQVTGLRRHLAKVHGDYITAFDRLMTRANEEQDK